MTSTVGFDPKDLESKVKAMYRDVAENPSGEFHFEMGRAMAERLGYEPEDLDRIPAAAIESFAGVGYYFDLAALKPGETVIDLGSGSGMDSFIAGLKEAGFGLFIWGLVATSVPMLLAPYIGKYVFRFHDAINLGCCGGARTSTASVAMVGEVAKSDVPMLGYTVPYAVSNTLLTLWGLIIVLLVT